MTYDEWKTTEPTIKDLELERERYEQEQEDKFMRYYEDKE